MLLEILILLLLFGMKYISGRNSALGDREGEKGFNGRVVESKFGNRTKKTRLFLAL